MGELTTSDAALRVLLALRLRSFAATEVVADAAGLGVDEVAAMLQELADRELVKHRDGKLTGWLLTPAGRVEGERLLAAELDAADAGLGDAIRDGYRRFLDHNHRLLEVCTNWQLKGGASSQELNDHTDPAYDAQVIGELRELDAAVQPVCSALASALDRFSGYGERFAAALARVEAGEPDYFTKPIIDSYHTIWFELHENLLATLGIERSKEGGG